MENSQFLIYVLLPGSMAALFLAVFLFKRLIRYAGEGRLLDMPDERKKHVNPTPTSGGLVFGVIATLMLPVVYLNTSLIVPVIFSILLLVLGFVDDRYDLSAKLKFFFQILATVVVIGILGVVDWFHTGIYELNYIITFMFILGFTNAYNLIDGVDGLAGTYGALLLSLAGLFLFLNGSLWEAFYAFVLTASIVAFLFFNLAPAKIFMGDTGSLFIGFSLAFFIVLIVNGPSGESVFPIEGTQLQVLCLSALILPCFDTIRVMLSRVLRRKSPFKADRSHLHHLLWKTGLRANGIAICFALGTLFFFLEAFLMAVMGVEAISILFAVILTAVLAFNGLIIIRIRQHQKKMQAYEYQLEAITIKNYLVQKN